MNDEEANFKDKLELPRYRPEHCLGAWKGRFPFLKKMRLVLEEEKESMIKILHHIKVSTTLNIFLFEKDEGSEIFYDEDSYGSDIDADN